jgi:hypothetical protein
MKDNLVKYNLLDRYLQRKIGHRSWQKIIHNSLQNLNLTSVDFDINKINQLLTDQHFLMKDNLVK